LGWTSARQPTPEQDMDMKIVNEFADKIRAKLLYFSYASPGLREVPVDV